MATPPIKQLRGASSWIPTAPFPRRVATWATWSLSQSLTIVALAQPGTFPALAQTEMPGESRSPTARESQQHDPEDAAESAQRAKLEFAKGNDAYEKGNYREAAEAFERAHDLSPHSAVLFNAARAWWKMGESERAADDYAAAIARGELTSEQTLRARSALSNLRKKLGWIIVSGPSDASASVGHKQDTPLPFTAHLTPGDHVLFVQHAGETWEQIVTVQADSPLSVVAKKDRPAAPAPPRSRPREPAPKSNRQRDWGWFTLSMGGVLGAGAVVTGVLTLRARDEFNALNDGSEENLSAAESERDRATTLRTVTNVLAFTGGATALSGLTIVLTAPRRTRARRSGEIMSLAISTDRIHLQGTF